MYLQYPQGALSCIPDTKVYPDIKATKPLGEESKSPL
jgi:hypothetical protein